MTQYTLTILFILFAVAAIFFKHKQKKILFYFTKPTATLILIAMLYFTKIQTSALFFPILIALVFSFFGDVFLLFDDKGFQIGIIAFLFAHISYSFAFMRQVNNYNYYLLIPIFGFTVGFYLYIVKDLGKFRRQVSIYISVITLMFWLAVNRYFFENTFQNTLILAGAVMFVISDSLLAVNKFSKTILPDKTKFLFPEMLILAAYYLAQYLFVISV